jgi:hypothetical protein
VGVYLDFIGQVVVDYVADVLHIKAARGHIGRHEQLQVIFAKTLHHPVAVALRQVAVQGIGVVAVANHLLGHFFGVVFCAAKNQAINAGQRVNHAFEGGKTIIHAAHIVDVLDVFVGLIAFTGGQLQRIVHIIVRNGTNGFGHSGRKKPYRFAIACGAENKVDGFFEAHVEHLIGFIEYDAAHLIEANGFAREQIHKAAGRGYHDLCAGFDLANLAFNASAAIHRHNFVLVGELRIIFEVFGNLYAKLAGRAKHEALHFVACCPINALQERQAEGGRFSGAGLSKGKDIIVVAQSNGNNQFLNRGGGGETERFNAAQKLGLEAQLFKSCHKWYYALHVHRPLRPKNCKGSYLMMNDEC